MAMERCPDPNSTVEFLWDLVRNGEQRVRRSRLQNVSCLYTPDGYDSPHSPHATVHVNDSTLTIDGRWGQICFVKWYATAELMKGHDLFAKESDWGPIQQTKFPEDLWPMTPFNYGAIDKRKMFPDFRDLVRSDGGREEYDMYVFAAEYRNGVVVRTVFLRPEGAKPPSADDEPSTVEFRFQLDMETWIGDKRDLLVERRPDWQEFLDADYALYGNDGTP